MQVVSQERVREVYLAVRHVAAVVVAGSVVAACVAPFPPELHAENHDRVARVLGNAYEEVTENYVDRVEVAELAIAGLGNLSQLEPAFSVHTDAQVVSLKLRGEEIHSFSKPPADDVDAWADAAADALIAARTHSGAVRARSGKQVFEKHMEGVAAALPRGAHYATDEESRAEWSAPKYDGGVMFTYRRREEGLELWRLDPGGRLEAAGLRKGDVLTHVNFALIPSLTYSQMSSLLAGPEGSTVTFTVLRGEPASAMDFRVARWKQEFPSFEVVRHEGIAVFQAPYLNVRVTHELTARLGTELRKARYGEMPLTGLVLDLRGNIGSNELVSTDMANAFLGKGIISTQRTYRSQPKTVINASWPDHSENLPLVVLVDGVTGFGAEEVVAALQDNDRALVIGSSTAGEGIDFDKVSLYNMGHVTMPVAFSHAPSGYGLAGRGVMPNICTSTTGTTFDDVMAALRRGEGMIDPEIRQRHIDPEDGEALAAFRELCPPDVDQAGVALDLALAILKELKLYARLMQQAGSS